MAAMLANATLHTVEYYGSDVKVAYRLTQSLLRYESHQQGFSLTATQDVHFTEVTRQHTTLHNTILQSVTHHHAVQHKAAQHS